MIRKGGGGLGASSPLPAGPCRRGSGPVVRHEARAHLTARTGRKDPDPDNPAEVADTCAAIEAGLARILDSLRARGIGEGLRLAPGSVRLPWRRTFEVDFDLEEARPADPAGSKQGGTDEIS
jgi:hypothetical protein